MMDNAGVISCSSTEPERLVVDIWKFFYYLATLVFHIHRRHLFSKVEKSACFVPENKHYWNSLPQLFFDDIIFMVLPKD